MGLLILNNLIHDAKNWNFFVLLEFEYTGFPNLLDVIQLLLDFVLFLGTIDKLSYLFSEVEKLKLNQIMKAELW